MLVARSAWFPQPTLHQNLRKISIVIFAVCTASRCDLYHVMAEWPGIAKMRKLLAPGASQSKVHNCQKFCFLPYPWDSLTHWQPVTHKCWPRCWRGSWKAPWEDFQRDSAPLHSYLLLDTCILLVPLQKLGAGLKDQVSTHRKEINFFND